MNLQSLTKTIQKETEAFVFDKDLITQKEARDFKEREKIQVEEKEKNLLTSFSEGDSSDDNTGSDGETEPEDKSDLAGDDENQGEDGGEPKGTTKKKETIPDPIKTIQTKQRLLFLVKIQLLKKKQ